MRRIQRFVANYALDLDIVAWMTFAILPQKENLVHSKGPTNWKFGEAMACIALMRAYLVGDHKAHGESTIWEKLTANDYIIMMPEI